MIFFAQALKTKHIRVGYTERKGGAEERLRGASYTCGEPLIVLAAIPGGSREQACLVESFGDLRTPINGDNNWYKPEQRLLDFINCLQEPSYWGHLRGALVSYVTTKKPIKVKKESVAEQISACQAAIAEIEQAKVALEKIDDEALAEKYRIILRNEWKMLFWQKDIRSLKQLLYDEIKDDINALTRSLQLLNRDDQEDLSGYTARRIKYTCGYHVIDSIKREL